MYLHFFLKISSPPLLKENGERRKERNYPKQFNLLPYLDVFSRWRIYALFIIKRVILQVYHTSKRSYNFSLLEDGWNYMPPILVPSYVKRIATQILVIAKLNGRKNFI